jgi:type IV secretory pathway protease TraF
VNGRVVPRSGLPSAVGGRGGPGLSIEVRARRLRVPAGQVFLLGDNAAVSYDGRSFGSISETEIVGRIRMVVAQPGWLPVSALAALALVLGGVLVFMRRGPPAEGP